MNPPTTTAPEGDDSAAAPATAETCTDEPDDMNSCCRSCLLVHGCDTSIAVDTCVARCEASNWTLLNKDYCLATRILWIDEDGCDRILATWHSFNDNDLCL
jgi:hypothetical protein